MQVYFRTASSEDFNSEENRNLERKWITLVPTCRVLVFFGAVVVVVLNIASKFKTDVNKLPNTHRDL